MSDTNKSEIEAAERYGRFDLYEPNELDDGLHLRDAATLASWACRRLAADRAEREERARPIDAEWLESIGFRISGVWHEMRVGAVRLTWSYRTGLWIDKSKLLSTITTRGKLLDLLRALKGGDA